jgi:hypothetical protein
MVVGLPHTWRAARIPVFTGQWEMFPTASSDRTFLPRPTKILNVSLPTPSLPPVGNTSHSPEKPREPRRTRLPDEIYSRIPWTKNLLTTIHVTHMSAITHKSDVLLTCARCYSYRADDLWLAWDTLSPNPPYCLLTDSKRRRLDPKRAGGTRA